MNNFLIVGLSNGFLFYLDFLNKFCYINVRVFENLHFLKEALVEVTSGEKGGIE